MQKDAYLPIRLPSETKQILQELGEKTGFAPSTIARSLIVYMIGQQDEASRAVNSAVRRVTRNKPHEQMNCEAEE